MGPRHVVTAAHCTVIWDSPDQVEVVAGDHDRTVEEGSEQVNKIQFCLLLKNCLQMKAILRVETLNKFLFKLFKNFRTVHLLTRLSV